MIDTETDDFYSACKFGSSPEDSPLLEESVGASTPDNSLLNEVASPGDFRSGDSTDCGEEGSDRARDDDDDSKHNKYCHFCQHVKVKASAMLACSNKGCARRFCEQCLVKQLGDNLDPSSCAFAEGGWKCPICRKTCCCTAQQSCTKFHRHCKAYRYRRRRAEISAKKHNQEKEIQNKAIAQEFVSRAATVFNPPEQRAMVGMQPALFRCAPAMREVTMLFLQYSLGDKCDAYGLSGLGNCASTPETIGRNMPNSSFQYPDLGAPRFSCSAPPGTADSSMHPCPSMESGSAGFRGGHGLGSLDGQPRGLGSLGFDGQDLGSCAPRSMGLLHESGPGGFGQQGKGASAGYAMPHRFEAMKARSFVEEAQSTVMAVPISNPGSANDVMAQSYQGLAPRMRKDCRSTDNGFMGMPAPQPGAANGFFTGGPNGCAIPNQGLTRMSKCSTDLISDGFSAGFPLSNRGALQQAPCCNQNIFESAFAYSQQGKQRVSDNLQNPQESRLGMSAPQGQASNFVREAASVTSFHGDATRDAVRSGSTASSFGDCLSVDTTSSAKRLIRTDSHERLSSISSERANAENLFYCKGRRWGGSSENLRRLTSGMSPCASFENLSNLIPHRGGRDRDDLFLAKHAAAHSTDGSPASEAALLHASLGSRLRRVADERAGCSPSMRRSFCEEDFACFPEEVTAMHRNSSIDNLLASGVINAGEGAYQFLAHSISEIDLVELDHDDNAPVSSVEGQSCDAMAASRATERTPGGAASARWTSGGAPACTFRAPRI